MPSHTPGEAVLNPADNAGVITVGALDSERSSYSFRLNKPDLVTMSSVKTTAGEFRGSSNSAAFVAGAIGLVKSRHPQRKISSIIADASLPNWNDNERGLSTYWLGFGAAPTGQCFRTFTEANMPQYVLDILNLGGLMVQTSAGLRLMTPYNPALLNSHLNPDQGYDYVLTSPEGLRGIPRQSGYIPSGWVELFQTPQEATLCDQPLQALGRLFRLPNN
jgi:subtilisin family serine protease